MAESVKINSCTTEPGKKIIICTLKNYKNKMYGKQKRHVFGED